MLLMFLSATLVTMSLVSLASQTQSVVPRTSVNIAYLIQIVPATMPHLPRLFSRVYHPSNVYGLHFDVKIPQPQVNNMLIRLKAAIPNFRTNTHLIPPDVLIYNGVSMVLNTLSAITFLLQVPNEWDFFINLSGSDYPLTSPYLPRELLAYALPYSPQFFSFAPRDSWQARFKIRAENIYVDPSLTHETHHALPPLIETSHRNPLFDNVSFVPVHAEAWMILSRSFCDFVTISATARRMLLSVANMRGSDEFFFSSLAYNDAVFTRSLVPHSFRKVVWTHDGLHAGQHPYYIDQLKDGRWTFLDEIRQSPQWHARKFLHNDSAMMNLIDKFSNDDERVAQTRRDFHKIIARLRNSISTNTPHYFLT